MYWKCLNEDFKGTAQVYWKCNITSTTIIILNKKFNQNKSTGDRPTTLSCAYTILSNYGCKIFLMEFN